MENHSFDSKPLLEFRMPLTNISSYNTSSLVSGEWKSVSNRVTEGISSTTSPSIMSQVIPPSIIVPVPSETRAIEFEETNRMPFDVIEKAAHLCRISYWSQERVSKELTVAGEFDQHLENGFPILFDSPHQGTPTAYMWLFTDPRCLLLVFRGVGCVGESLTDITSPLTKTARESSTHGFLGPIHWH